jgi:hypothetical protein
MTAFLGDPQFLLRFVIIQRLGKNIEIEEAGPGHQNIDNEADSMIGQQKVLWKKVGNWS